MNIVVTIPKNRVAEVEAEEREVEKRIVAGEKDICYYWIIPSIPVILPQRIYFVWNGAVRAYHQIIKIDYGAFRTNTIKVLMLPEIHNLKAPIPMAGFRGWRYFREDVE